MAVDWLGQQYVAVRCSNLDSTAGAGRNEVFLALDVSKGLAVLDADEFVYSVSNSYAQDCVGGCGLNAGRRDVSGMLMLEIEVHTKQAYPRC